MKFEPNRCPSCLEPARSTLGSVLVDELMHYDESADTYTYADDSDIDWNCQTSEIDAIGRVNMSCPNGHTWRAEYLDRDQDELKAIEKKLGHVNVDIKMDVEHARLFLRQRRVLSEVLERADDCNLSDSEAELLIGLQNLCDHIADSLSDSGFPHCLMSRSENPDLAGISDDKFDNLTDAQIQHIHDSKSTAA